MKLKAETALTLGATALLAFAAAYLVSALALLKVKPCVKIQIAGELPKKEPLNLPYSVEREGFFLQKGKGAPKEEKRVEKEVIKTLGSYTLKGTVVCSECGHSIAILKDEKGKTVVISEGEEVEGYTLKKVYPQRVILKKGKKEFILELEEEKKESSQKTPQTKEAQTYTVNKREIIEQLSSGDFLKYINIVPSKEPEGLKVIYVNPRSFIYKLGIKPGDVIVSINDVTLKTPEDSFAAFEKLKSADNITITLIRKGKEVKLHYQLQ